MSSIASSPEHHRTRRLRRRLGPLLVGAVVAVALLATSAVAQTTSTTQAKSSKPADKINVGIVAGNPPGIVTAADEGYFADRNLDVNYVSLAGGPALIAALTGGSIDLTYGDVFAWLSAVNNGFDIVQVAPANSRIEGERGGTIVVKKDSPITKPKDLVGKKIGVPQTPLISVLTKQWLEENGVDPAKVEVVNLVTGTALAPALDAGQVDAIAIGEPLFTQLQSDLGIRQVGNSYYDYVPEGATIAAYYGRGDWVDQNKAVVKRFVEAVREGADTYTKSGGKYRNQVAVNHGGIDLTQLEAKYPGVQQNALVDTHQLLLTGPIDTKATQEWVDLGVKWGAITVPTKLKPHLYETATAKVAEPTS